MKLQLPGDDDQERRMELAIFAFVLSGIFLISCVIL